LALGVGLSALVAVLLPATVIERYLGGGLGTMLLMFLLGIPIYTCASASTPVAAALVLKGLSPGAALVFLLSGPATNLGALVVLLKFLGRRVMLIYLTTVAILSLGAGYALDWIYRSRQLNATASFGRAAQYIPDWVNVAAALVMIGLLLVSLWRTPVPAEWIRLRDWAAVLTGVGVTAKRLRVAAAGHPGFWYRREKVPEESFLLTGDENIIDIAFTVQYAVRDPVVFAYQVAEPEELVRSVAISVLRSIVATTTVDAIYTSARD